MNRTGYDASTPPPDPYLDVCGIYIGGDTPHVWTGAEIAGQSARWRLPIYVCDNPAQRNPTADAAEAVAWLRAHGVPAGSALALDYETAVNGGYVTAFDGAVRAAGWTLLLYGSLSSVTQNPRPSAGYWTASWTGVPHLDPGAAATQWASDTQLGTPYDLSDFSDSLVLWDTDPHPAPDPAPSDRRNDMHADLTLNNPVVFTNPAAVLGGQSTMLLASDFGDAEVRVATYSFQAAAWTSVKTYTVARTGGALSLPLPPDVNKISVEMTAGSCPVGLDVFA